MDQDLMRMAMSLCDESLTLMAQAIEAGDDAAWRQAAHRSRGSCGMLGFNRIAALLYDAEYGTDLTPEIKRRMMPALQAAMAELMQRLAAMGYAVSSANEAPNA
jgi:HPt (histidine-containing phosphotransfer) domain-containing protein